MAWEEIFFVDGGEHTSMDFVKIKPGKAVHLGPFYSYQEAYDAWKANSFLNVDNALYRLTIKKVIVSD